MFFACVSLCLSLPACVSLPTDCDAHECAHRPTLTVPQQLRCPFFARCSLSHLRLARLLCIASLTHAGGYRRSFIFPKIWLGLFVRGEKIQYFVGKRRHPATKRALKSPSNFCTQGTPKQQAVRAQQLAATCRAISLWLLDEFSYCATQVVFVTCGAAHLSTVGDVGEDSGVVGGVDMFSRRVLFCNNGRQQK